MDNFLIVLRRCKGHLSELFSTKKNWLPQVRQPVISFTIILRLKGFGKKQPTRSACSFAARRRCSSPHVALAIIGSLA